MQSEEVAEEDVGWKDCRSEKAKRQSSEVISNFGKEWNGEKKPLFIGNKGGTEEMRSLGFPKALSLPSLMKVLFT